MNPLPPLLKDFIRSVAPDAAASPLQELKERYTDRQQEEIKRARGAQPIHYPHGSPEWMVEMRIRDWVRRMEAEKAEAEKRNKGNPPAPPQIKPPAP
jgi:hypothetical protein